MDWGVIGVILAVLAVLFALFPWEQVAFMVVGTPSEEKHAKLDWAKRAQREAWSDLTRLHRSRPNRKPWITNQISNLLSATDVRSETVNQWRARVSKAETEHTRAMSALFEAHTAFYLASKQ